MSHVCTINKKVQSKRKKERVVNILHSKLKISFQDNFVYKYIVVINYQKILLISKHFLFPIFLLVCKKLHTISKVCIA